MKRTLRRIGIGLGGLALIWLLAATTLAFAPAPKLSHPARPAREGSTRLYPCGLCRDGAGTRCFSMRDGSLIAGRCLASDGNPTVIYLHGVLSTGAEFEEGARLLHESTGASVIRLDLRGHGLSAGTPGDLDHIGQWEEDVADVVSTIRRDTPGSQIVLAGHSMGGGVAMRYALRCAERRDVPEVDGYLLFAPHLGPKSPTSQYRPAKGAAAGPPLIRVNVPRIIGLVMLNAVGIHGLNFLPTLAFDLPGDLPIRSYTFRAMASMSPDDYRTALAADAKPLLTLVGEKDEAFQAKEYPAVVALHRNGKTVIIPGETHDGVIVSRESFEAIRGWLPAATR